MKQQKMISTATTFRELEEAGFYWRIGSYALLIGGSVHIGFIFFFAYLHVWELSFFNLISVAMYWYAIFGFILRPLHNEKEKDAKIGWIVFAELLSHNLLASYILGRESGFVYYIFVLIGLPFFVDAYAKKIFFLRKITAIGAVFFVEFCPCFDTNKTDVTQEMIALMHYGNLLLFLVVISMLTYVYADNAQAYQKVLREESDTDALTGLYNRRYVLRKQLAPSSIPPLAVAILDIDHFKQVNDTFGHHCGDMVIRQIAAEIQKAVDDDTTACRWGGEEFLLLYQTPDPLKIEQNLEAIRQRIETNTMVCGGQAIRVTLTAGAAYDLSHQSAFDVLLLRADKALYSGKTNGRNQVCIVNEGREHKGWL